MTGEVFPLNDPLAMPPNTSASPPWLYGLSLLLGLVVLGSAWLAWPFTASSFTQDLLTWQEKLNLIAETRQAEVSHWVSGHFKDLHTLADNPSLQLYMTELQAAKKTDSEPPQKEYLRNLLLYTASHAGFSQETPVSAIPADVPTDSKSGLAIIGSHDNIIVSTALNASTRDTMLEYATKAARGHDLLIDIRKDSDGVPVMGFLVPVYPVQGDHDAASQIGWVAGMLAVDGNLFSLLSVPGMTEKTLETILVRPDDGMVDYISPLRDGTKALNRRSLYTPSEWAVDRLIESPGTFVSTQKDYRDMPVLATSRTVAGTPWTLVTKIDRREALMASDQHRISMVIFFGLLVVAAVLIVVALWRYEISRRALQVSEYFRKLAAQTMAQEQLLRLVIDHQPDAVSVVDTTHTFHFANRTAAEAANMLPDSIAGKSLATVRGAASEQYIAQQCDDALLTGEHLCDIQRIVREDGQEAVIRSTYVPLEHIPATEQSQPVPGVLLIEQDISDIMNELEQRFDIQQQLIETLVRLVDGRDPLCADHSLLVSQIACEVAAAMTTDPEIIDTTRIAGSLMNIGKIAVPATLLTKKSSLKPAEKRQFSDAMHAAADVLKGVHFDGQVVETLQQWQEKWDGSGPLGLSGEAIALPARIIAVVNAFVGMVSPRAWREALSVDDAAKQLFEQCDSCFDRRVVIALMNYIENGDGREQIKKVAPEKEPA